MNVYNYEMSTSLKVSYYSTYKEWKLKANFAAWPFYLGVFLLILSILLSGDSSISEFLMFFNVFNLFFCVFATRFYTNSILEVSDKGLTVKTKNRVIDFEWSDISNLEFLIPKHKLSYLEIILAIHINDDNIEYVFIESLYFNVATKRAEILRLAIKEYLENKDLSLKKSDFEPFLLMKK